MKVLFLSRWYPYPPDNGARIRIFNLLKHLSSRYLVDLISYSESDLTDEQALVMSSFCHKVDTVVYAPFHPNSRRALMGFLSPLPRSVVDTYNPSMQNKINQAVVEGKYDVVIASQIDMAFYIRNLEGIKRVLEEIELSTLSEKADRASNSIARFRNRVMWEKWKHYIADLVKNVDGSTVVSQMERDRLVRLSHTYHPKEISRPIKIVPNGVDYKYNNSRSYDPPRIDTLLFNGALTYDANFDALRYFLEKIFPLIQYEHPSVRLFVTGSLKDVSLSSLPANENVIYTGYLSDIRPLVAESWVSVVPLRIGGGTRLKILESLSLGTPVVATSKGAEGLDLISGQDLLVADGPEDFSAAVLCLLRDAALRNQIGHSGQLTVAKRYDWLKIGPDFCDFIDQVVSGNVAYD